MYLKATLAVDIGSIYTKVVIRKNNKIKLSGLIRTPEKSMVDNNIIDTSALTMSIQKFLKDNKVKPTYVSYAIHGQDIIIRHIEVPIMDNESLKKTVEWELRQYLPENGTNYYIDHEIIDKVNTKDKKLYKILIAAAPKGKINKYIELSYNLGLKIRAIDIAANSAARVFRERNKSDSKQKSIAIFDIGYQNSNIIILDNGKLFIEKEVTVGVKNAILEITKTQNMNEQEAYEYLFQNFDFNHTKDKNMMGKNVQGLFNDVFHTFNKVIQFYLTGKTQKNVNSIYIVGGGCEIPGIIQYVKSYYNCPVYKLDNIIKVYPKLISDGFDFKSYVNALGLLLRKE